MSDRFHKPARLPGSAFEYHEGGEDPAITVRRAHESARMLIARGRDTDDGDAVERLITHTDEHGLDLVAQLWASVRAETLPGALWRLYLLRASIRSDAEGASVAYRLGEQRLGTIHPVVAGAAEPAGPDELVALADEILRGAFRGDLAAALDRASSSCRVSAAGWLELADARESASSGEASALTTRASRLTTIADELERCARLERRSELG